MRSSFQAEEPPPPPQKIKKPVKKEVYFLWNQKLTNTNCRTKNKKQNVKQNTKPEQTQNNRHTHKYILRQNFKQKKRNKE